MATPYATKRTSSLFPLRTRVRSVVALTLFGAVVSCQNPIDAPPSTSNPPETPPTTPPTNPPTTPPEATKLGYVVQPGSITAGASPTAIQVAVQDAAGAAVTGATTNVTLAITSGTGAAGAMLLGTLTQPAVNGVATFNNVTIHKAGTGYTITASASNLVSAVSSAFNVTPAPASKLVATTQPTSAIAGAAISPAVQFSVQDAYGNVPGGSTPPISLAITSGTGAPGASLDGTLMQSPVDGMATFNDISVGKSSLSGYSLTASGPGLTAVTTALFMISPGPAAKLLVTTQPATVNAGATITPSVQIAVQDGLGNVVGGSTAPVTIAITPGTGTSGTTLSGTLVQNAVSGVASFGDLKLDKVGAGYTLTASSQGLTGTTTNTFAVTPAAATKLAFTTQPSAVNAGATVSPAVQVTVQDASGNTVVNASTSVTLAITSGTGAAGATLGGTVTRAAVNGVATFDNLTINKASSGYKLDASAPNLSSVTSSAFTVSAGAAAKLQYQVQPSAANVSTAISPAIKVVVQDAQGNTVSAATNSITLAITPATGTSGAVLGGTVTRAAVSGVATFNDITIDKAGTGYTLTATATSLASTVSTGFTINDVSSGTSCANPAPDWIWCDDFEADRYASYFESSTSFVRVAGVGRNGSTGVRARWSAGGVDAGNLKLAFGRTPSAYIKPVDAGTKDYREIYWRLYLRHQPGWIGGGADKLSRATIFAKADWSQAMIAHVWSGTGADINYLWAAPASGTDEAGNLLTSGYNDFAHLRWFPGGRTSTPLYDANHVGQWYCIETHVKLNTAGQSNGIMELFINGNLEASEYDLNYIGSYSAYGINAVLVENWWNAGSPVQQERYMDDFVVSEKRIGC